MAERLGNKVRSLATITYLHVESPNLKMKAHGNRIKLDAG
jgi:hypothetical protein